MVSPCEEFTLTWVFNFCKIEYLLLALHLALQFFLTYRDTNHIEIYL